MKVLVTGGAGFIGSHIVDQLVQKYYDVVIVDNLSTGKIENVNPKAVFYKCDITDAKQLAVIFEKEKPNKVIHHAAQISVTQSIQYPNQDVSVNISGTINLLQCCIQFGVRKIIYASSAAVYGDPEYLPIDENHKTNPLSPYGLSKYASEHYIFIYQKLYGLDYTILRYSNVYGPRQDAQGEGGVVSIFIDKLLHQKPIVIYGDGKQTRDLIYVEDIADANLAALEHGSGKVINISTNLRTTVKDLLNSLCIVNNSFATPYYHAARPGDIKHSYLDNEKGKKELDWKPKYDLYRGLERTLSFYKAYENKVANIG